MKYTVTDIQHTHGDYFYHNGVKYQRLHIGGSIFDIKVAGKKEVADFKNNKSTYSHPA